ncbi:hypothetical protein [Mycolicibacterium wolinskyi]|uniref:hypothetical protein n=1 Tax=Mycolicibacterium wolinskyi TaxID=59750 RepID=UPI003917A1D1
MTVAALVLGIVGTVLAALSLGWNVAQYLLSGARPRLVPVIGAHYGGGAFPVDATVDARPTLLALEAQFDADPDDRIVGVRVVNRGRADLRVTGWDFRVLPAGPRQFPALAPGSPAIPCTIPPGGEETFFTSAATVRAAAVVTQAVDGRSQRLVATITSGGRTYESAPIYTPMLTDLDR